MSKPENFKRAFGRQGHGQSVHELRKELILYSERFGVTDGKGLIDLGDGVMRPLDDILADLTNRGVISGQSTPWTVMRLFSTRSCQMGVKESTEERLSM